MKTTLLGGGLMVIVLALSVTACNETSQHNAWGWKRAIEPDDVMNFLSRKPPYTQNITNAEVTAADKGGYVDYITFYQADPAAGPPGNWGWKRTEQPDDVMNFLNATAT